MESFGGEKAQVNTAPIYTYFGAITLLLYLATPNGYLVDIATAYMLKNGLHASPETVAQFRFLSALPIYVSFIFGLTRDRWNPLGLRDRGFFLIFAPLTGLIFVVLAIGKLQYTTLLIGIMAAMVTFGLVSAAYQGLMSLVAQEKLMSGRLATLWNTALCIPSLVAAWSSGWVTGHLTASQIFFVLAGLCLALGLLGLWKPVAVFSETYSKPQAQHLNFWQDVKRLAKHKAIYPAILINFLFNFSPGSATPLQFYLTDKLHLPDWVYANYTALFAISFVPTLLLYGFLCKRFILKKMLFWGTLVCVPQMVPLAFINSALSAQIMAVVIGLLGGVAVGAMTDLAIRSCPPGLQGSLMMIVAGLMNVSARGGDLLGTQIYQRGGSNGFLYCVIATTTVYASILPILWWVPKSISSTRDGEANPGLESEDREELGMAGA